VNTPKQIGITGGIGAGKSLVCRIFNTLGIPVYDADSRAKSVMTTDGILITQIKKEFGVLSYHADGSINREHLAEAFKSPERLKALNQLVHPRVAYDYKQWVSEQQTTYVIKEAALLFEAKSNIGLDKTIMVYAPMELRIKRVLQRDTHRNRQLVEEIIKSQMPDEEKLKLADFVVTNDDTQLVIPQVLALHDQFLKLS
jgi:dephospho-CoA kinase